jgi:hypothetical protein
MPRAFEAKPSHPAVDYLVRLHSDLAGRRLACRKEAKRLADSMKHVEAVIRLFNPAYDVRRIAVRRRNRKNAWFKRGTMFRACLDVLRKSAEPMTARQLTEAILAVRGAADPTLKQVRDLQCGIQSCLRRLDGKSVRKVGEGMPARWVTFD